MKTMSIKTLLVILCAAYGCLGLASAQQGAMKLFSANPQPTQSPQIVWGAVTNNLCGGLAIKTTPTHFEITVYVRQSTNSTKHPSTRAKRSHGDEGTNVGDIAAGQEYWDTMIHLSATNSFCGPIELVAENGLPVPPGDHGLFLLAAYPPAFKYSDVVRNEMKKANVSHIIAARRIDFNGGNPEPLVSFNIFDIFRPAVSGHYRLTVFPKIYQRSDHDPDLFERIDIPPVSVTITIPPPETTQPPK
jgi:hypothetical protein